MPSARCWPTLAGMNDRQSTQYLLTLRIDPEDHSKSIAGRIAPVGGGAASEFVGWLGLAEALQGAVDVARRGEQVNNEPRAESR
jgi:hypothetical protein